jgi:hypothetical protein
VQESAADVQIVAAPHEQQRGGGIDHDAHAGDDHDGDAFDRLR